MRLLVKSNWFHWLHLPETLSFLWNWPPNKFSFWLGHFLSSVSWNIPSRITYSLSSRKETGLKAALGGSLLGSSRLVPVSHRPQSSFWLWPHELTHSFRETPWVNPFSLSFTWSSILFYFMIPPYMTVEKLYFLPFCSRSSSNRSSTRSMRLYFTWIPSGIWVVPLALSYSLVPFDCSYA